MTSRKGKKVATLEGNFSFSLETGDIRQRSTTIKSSPRFEFSVTPPSSTRMRESRSPQEVSDLKGQEMLLKGSVKKTFKGKSSLSKKSRRQWVLMSY
jgi:hypothetical protein